MLEKLRAATQELHEKIEGENTADLIMKHSISVEQYNWPTKDVSDLAFR